MLAKAKEEWEQEQVDKQGEKERYLAERITSLHTSGLSYSQLQVDSWEWRGCLCGHVELHRTLRSCIRKFNLELQFMPSFPFLEGGIIHISLGFLIFLKKILSLFFYK